LFKKKEGVAMKVMAALLVLLMGASATNLHGAPIYRELVGKVDPMTGIYLQDEFTLKFLPAFSKGDTPALKTILEEREKILAEEGESAMLLYQIGVLHFSIGERYFILEFGKEGILHHTGEAVRVLERAIELGLEKRYLPFAHGYIGGAMGTRALHVGILASLAGLVGLDRHITTAIRLGEEYWGITPPLSIMYAVRGRRFRDTPWFVGGSNRRAMKYFRKAVELDPGFLNNYEDIAMTYEKMGNKPKAIEYWQKAIDLPLQERYWQWGIEVKERAEEALQLLKGGS
jgi:tetratricopeptide (TPR) repeat protein